MLKNGFDLAPGYAREPLQKIVDGRTVLDIVKQGTNRYTSSLENPSATDAAWVLFNTSAVGPLNHHAVMLPPRCGKLNRDFIFARTSAVNLRRASGDRLDRFVRESRPLCPTRTGPAIPAPVPVSNHPQLCSMCGHRIPSPMERVSVSHLLVPNGEREPLRVGRGAKWRGQPEVALHALVRCSYIVIPATRTISSVG